MCRECGRWGDPPPCEAMAVHGLCTATVRVCCFSVQGAPHSRFNCRQRPPESFWYEVVFDEEQVVK
jgi:hypothetical protein